jgi:transposase
MDKETRNLLFNTTQAIRRLLEEEFSLQLEGTFDVHADGRIAEQPGSQLSASERLVRCRIVEAIQHRLAVGESAAEAVRGFQSEAVFTFLNRLAALKMMEARALVLPCVSQGDQSQGFKEFSGLAPGLIELPDKGYRLYLECLFDEIGREVGVLFDRTDAASQLWPRRKTLEAVLTKLNTSELAGVWAEDETIGWIYQYYNDPEERALMRDPKRGGSAAPRNSREMAVRNQFFTPRYVVEFLTDNALGRLWYEMTKGKTQLVRQCRYLIRRTSDVFLGNPSLLSLLDTCTPWVREVIHTANFTRLPEDPLISDLSDLALGIDAYGEMERRGRSWDDFITTFYNPQAEASERYDQPWTGDAFELWCALFTYQRAFLREGSVDSAAPASTNPILRHLWLALRTALQNPATDASQEALLRQPQFIPHRPIKDPREIRIIDPACGSMHFGLYAFDLLEVIYTEAHEAHVSVGTGSLRNPSGQPELHTIAEDPHRFAQEVPRLIIERNIHGIDIDPRAAQIAGLALWLRAQKSWQRMGLKPADRPTIRRSNIVCAEPMPGERDLLREFVQQRFPAPERALFLSFLENVWEKMRLAGEAGSLLQIEEEIRELVATAKQQWKDRPKGEQIDLFQGMAPIPAQVEMRLDVSGITDEQFWAKVEERVYSALRTFAEKSESVGGFQRRLFAEDAARGFAFIDLCRQRYDVALMNPPFGDASLPSKPYLDDTYGDTKGDVYKAFVECFQARLVPAGYLGIISSRTGFFLGGSEDWRTRVVLRLFRPIALADLGSGVLDAMVEVAAYVLRSLSAPEARDLTHSIVPVLEKVVRDSQDRFSLPKWQAARGGLKRHQAVAELEHLEAHGFVQRSSGDTVRYAPLWQSVKKVSTLPAPSFPPFVCVRVLADEDKGAGILHSIEKSADSNTFISNPSEFLGVAGTPFSYWVSPSIRRLFRTLSPFESDSRIVRQGLATADDFRFIRAVWEVEVTAKGCGWIPLVKGGKFSPFYADTSVAVSWIDDGHELKAWIETLPGCAHWSRRIANTEHYFRPGLTWPLRAKAFSPQAMPKGCVFSVRGYAILAPEGELASLLGTTASSTFDYLFKVLLGRFGFPEFVVGVLQKLPLPMIGDELGKSLATHSRRAWAAKRAIDTVHSTSHAFLLPALPAAPGGTLAERAIAWAARVRTSEDAVAAIQSEIDDLAFRLYGLNASDRAALTSTLATEATGEAEVDADEEEEEATAADTTALTADLLAYSLGCVFGRWDIRYATCERPAPEPPDPFAPLPVCPPGQLQTAEGLPARPEDIPANYPIRIPWDGILVDDENHPRDVIERVHETLRILWKDRADTIEHEACEILGVKCLRDWFRKPGSFFADHLKRYSKSRRQAPIYWPMSSPNGLYTVWLYYHRLTADTLFTVLRDYLKPKLEFEERRAFQLRQEAGTTPSPSQRRDLAEAEELVEDLRAFKAELERVAPLFRPNLNDGVIINYAPLWRMIGLPKWRKDCQAIWNELAKGDYDWAHLAMHLWPERVVPKCATDRSLAIAHGLEASFWQEDPEKPGKWIARKVTDQELRGLIVERTSAAVKAAVDSLVEQQSMTSRSVRRKNA